MSVFKCADCGTVWTNKQTRTKVDAKKVKIQRCVDCATFDWPNYNKGKAYAEKALAKPGKK